MFLTQTASNDILCIIMTDDSPTVRVQDGRL